MPAVRFRRLAHVLAVGGGMPERFVLVTARQLIARIDCALPGAMTPPTDS